ncbi:MAG: glycosyltransferase family 39 protein [Candidatus Gastranaerophilales bacterium]|nr:glycosyltransferase family 39 protein [Candidatus Gastranaerophilales bacterium]
MKELSSLKITRILILTAIILFGFYLRCIGIIKPDGLWNDEMYSVLNARLSFPFGILNNIYQVDIHPPLYFFLLHFWMKIFGTTDTILRLFSVFTGVLCIPVAYFAGKNLLNYKTGFIAALFISVNSFLIYFSQEVRPYSLIAFLMLCSVLFLTRIKNKPSLKNYVGLILSNLGILYTTSTGIVIIGIQAIIFFIYLLSSNKNHIKSYIYSQIITGVLFLPYLPILFHHISEMKNYLANPLFLKHTTTFYVIPATIQSWFTPILTDMKNAPSSFLVRFNDPYYIYFLVFPIIIILIGVAKSLLSKDNYLKVLFLSALSFFIFLFINSYYGDGWFCVRYTVSILVILLLCASYGLNKIKNSVISSFLASLFIVINFVFITNYNGAPEITRGQNFNKVAEFIIENNFNYNDYIFMPQGGYILNRYDINKTNIINFDMNTCDNHMSRVLENTLGKNLAQTLSDKKKLLNFLKSSKQKEVLPVFDAYITNIFNNIKPNHYFIIISGNVTKSNLQQLGEKDLYTILYLKIFQDINVISNKKLKLKKYTNIGNWKISVFQKSEI